MTIPAKYPYYLGSGLRREDFWSFLYRGRKYI